MSSIGLKTDQSRPSRLFWYRASDRPWERVRMNPRRSHSSARYARNAGRAASISSPCRWASASASASESTPGPATRPAPSEAVGTVRRA